MLAWETDELLIHNKTENARVKRFLTEVRFIQIKTLKVYYGRFH